MILKLKKRIQRIAQKIKNAYNNTKKWQIQYSVYRVNERNILLPLQLGTYKLQFTESKPSVSNDAAAAARQNQT